MEQETTPLLSFAPSDTRDNFRKIIGLMISPVLGILMALPHINTKSSFIVLFIAFACMGLAVTTPEYETEDFNLDAVRYRQMFEEVASNPYADFAMVMLAYVAAEGGEDLLAPVLYYSVSHFTNNYHVLFLVIACIFSFFMLKTLKYFVCEPNYQNSILCLILLFLFTSNQIFNINAYRFFIAMWIAMWCIFKIFIDHKHKYLIPILFLPLVHASCLVLWVVIPCAFIIRRYPKLLLIILIISLALTPFTVEIAGFVISHLPGSLSAHFGSYLDPQYMYEINESGSGMKWVVRLFESLVVILTNVVAIFFAYNYKTRIEDSKCKTLYVVLLTLIAFCNITMIIPSAGSRYLMYALPLIAYIHLVCFADDRKYNIWIYGIGGLFILFFLLLPWKIYSLPCLHYYGVLWDASILYKNPLWLLFEYGFHPVV